MATFTNIATLSYNGNVKTSNIVSGTLQEVLTASKTAVPENYSKDRVVTYIITLVNSGSTNLTDLTVADDLGAYTVGTQTVYPLTYVFDNVHYYINGVLQAKPTVTETNGIQIEGINVPANGNAMLIYETKVNEYTPMSVGSSIENNVTVTGTGLSSAVTASENISVTSESLLTISKSLNPTVITDNSQLTYTFLIENSGNVIAGEALNIILSDTFDPSLNSITVTFNGTAWTSPTNYTYDETTGVFSTVQGQIIVPAATYSQDPNTGIWSVTPGVSTLVVTGTV